MAPTKEKDPKVCTIYGRLSFPTWTAKEAYDKSLKGTYPAKDIGSAAPDFQLLVEQGQFDKLLQHVEDLFLPYCVKQHADGEKRDRLEADEAKDLLEGIKKNLAKQTFNTPFKPVHEKTALLAPECVAAIKCIGTKGADLEQKAVVNEMDELLVEDLDLLKFPVIRPIGQTVHQMYPGAYVAATLNLYAYHNGKHPGFSAGVSAAVFRANADRFGGGTAVDEDEIFMD